MERKSMRVTVSRQLISDLNYAGRHMEVKTNKGRPNTVGIKYTPSLVIGQLGLFYRYCNEEGGTPGKFLIGQFLEQWKAANNE